MESAIIMSSSVPLSSSPAANSSTFLSSIPSAGNSPVPDPPEVLQHSSNLSPRLGYFSSLISGSMRKDTTGNLAESQLKILENQITKLQSQIEKERGEREDIINVVKAMKDDLNVYKVSRSSIVVFSFLDVPICCSM